MKFSLRTLLSITFVIALLCAYGGAKWRAQLAVQAELERINAELRAGEEAFSGIIDTSTPLEIGK